MGDGERGERLEEMDDWYWEAGVGGSGDAITSVSSGVAAVPVVQLHHALNPFSFFVFLLGWVPELGSDPRREGAGLSDEIEVGREGVGVSETLGERTTVDLDAKEAWEADRDGGLMDNDDSLPTAWGGLNDLVEDAVAVRVDP